MFEFLTFPPVYIFGPGLIIGIIEKLICKSNPLWVFFWMVAWWLIIPLIPLCIFLNYKMPPHDPWDNLYL